VSRGKCSWGAKRYVALKAKYFFLIWCLQNKKKAPGILDISSEKGMKETK
jgi:hypothetical protein